jgi:hypothetical protein
MGKSVDLPRDRAMMELSTPHRQRIIVETDLWRVDAEESHGLDGAL